MPNAFEARQPGGPVTIGIAGQDSALEPVIRILESETAQRKMNLRLRRFPLPDLSRPDASRQLFSSARQGGFDAVHFADPLRRDITDLLSDRRSPLRPGRLVDTLLFGADGPPQGCDAGTFALQDQLAPFLSRHRAEHVLIIGAGTEGQSVAMALAALGVERLTFYDHDMGRAAALANLIHRATGARAALLATTDGLFHEMSRPGVTLGWLDGIVNATPVGSAQRPGQVLPDCGLAAPLWIVDIAATEGATPLTRVARARGCALLTGADIARRRAERLFQCSAGATLTDCGNGSCRIDLGLGALPLSIAG